MTTFDILLYSLVPAFFLVWLLVLLFFGEKSKWRQNRKRRERQPDIDQSKTAHISNNNTANGANR